MEWHTNGYADNTYEGSFVSGRRGRTFKYPQFIQKLPRCQSLFCGCRQKLFPFITPTGHVQDVAPHWIHGRASDNANTNGIVSQE